MELPPGFTAHVGNIGIRDDTTDFAVIACSGVATAAARFTRSRFAGPSVEVSRRALADERLRAVVVVSKNANVATGAAGLADAEELAQRVGDLVEGEPTDVLVTSTGVIGRPYPMDRVRRYLDDLTSHAGRAERFPVTDAGAVAEAMMTTDTVPKMAEAQVGDCRIVGVAKGVGMIEPDMATMLAFVFTDAELPAAELDRMFGRVVDRTFNSLSVDTDTSTSDTAAVLASGLGGPVNPASFEVGLEAVCLDLTRQLASDGEGAQTLIVVRVEGARDDDQARRAAKAVVNSPLVKTAVHGADPNWGRVVMAIGKLSDDNDIDQQAVSVRFGEAEVYPKPPDDVDLTALSDYMAGDEVLITVDLAIADGAWVVYGCDLTDGYVRINADYTT
ncbi:MAG: bifunctional glutamate N-acetyltransferase/amino-acid acetyltransferase ArgJ [Candidatus Microthrix sp.]|jgi:glutamate N-acetyltransferase/amino-acid N-acetyltransferase|uniref:Arginine biosynthesis bifunctional protein ArgJ n=1 Tax=Candidatus Neomicrothrix subdominans TaxID=2954438 RepID=A0A936NCC4_9ACTN|nr:bifunctional glutamate N-acetyltransferase/amino-acid acetyltransferase ArgJ [Candidatus Microthrix sp.]MBK9296224.1 bifunctional glutamate N-acetyltransferase/amino-acid acetyltransferase ArgJ [Candidatus Microthrix subdominans]MBP9065295.1 bifunctional glutamate N-acetyltransferase/amino-acid acetyltransferase ArgJ [Candidatus Microthrix sp.]